MFHYVNHHAIAELFAPAAAEHDPIVRAAALDTIQVEFIESLIELMERTAYELKMLNWNTGQIADHLGVSERKVKTLIGWHSARTGEWNPLKRRETETVIDISHFVQRKKNGAEKASPPNSAPLIP
jgi:hypothetical protein